MVKGISVQDTLIKKVQYKASYRGTKEADSIIGQFVRHNAVRMTVPQLEALDLILEADDDDILDSVEDPVSWSRLIPVQFDGQTQHIQAVVEAMSVYTLSQRDTDRIAPKSEGIHDCLTQEHGGCV